MPSTELTHVFRVPAPPAEVFAHLAEPTSYVGLSPLVVAVHDIRRTDGITHYTAVERFRFLKVFRYDNVLRVSLVAVGDGLPRAAEVGGDVRSPGGVRMAYRFSLAEEAAGSVVTDTLRLHAPLGLLRFAASRARAVQTVRARILTERLA